MPKIPGLAHGCRKNFPDKQRANTKLLFRYQNIMATACQTLANTPNLILELEKPPPRASEATATSTNKG